MAAPIVPGSPPPVFTPQHSAATTPANHQMLRHAFLTELSRLGAPVTQRTLTSQTAHSPAPSQITFIPLTAACAPAGQAGANTTQKSAAAKRKKNRDSSSGPLTPMMPKR